MTRFNAGGVFPRAALLGAALLGAALSVLIGGVPAFAGESDDPGEEAGGLEWRVVFKLINLTSHAESGQVGYLSETGHTREQNEQSVRLQLTGRPLDWLSFRFDYRNVKQNRDAALSSDRPADIELYRRRPWRKWIEPPRSGSSQNVQWFHEIDHAHARIRLGAVDAVIGRQPITWGAGRIWQPTDLFASFSPLALDTEFKAGVDAALLSAAPSDLSEVTLAYVLSKEGTPEEPQASDSIVLHWRAQVGAESEVTLLAGSRRGESLAGGSLETAWAGAGWRLEMLAFRPRDTGRTETQSIAGMDLQLSGGMLLVAEAYHNTQGATDEAELRLLAGTLSFAEGRMPQLSRTVLALGASDELSALWRFGYTLFTAPLRGDDGGRHYSFLHQLRFTYSAGEETEAVLALTTATGRGLADGAFRSEFGHLADSLYISIQIVF